MKWLALHHSVIIPAIKEFFSLFLSLTYEGCWGVMEWGLHQSLAGDYVGRKKLHFHVMSEWGKWLLQYEDCAVPHPCRPGGHCETTLRRSWSWHDHCHSLPLPLLPPGVRDWSHCCVHHCVGKEAETHHEIFKIEAHELRKPWSLYAVYEGKPLLRSKCHVSKLGNFWNQLYVHIHVYTYLVSVRVPKPNQGRLPWLTRLSEHPIAVRHSHILCIAIRVLCSQQSWRSLVLAKMCSE